MPVAAAVPNRQNLYHLIEALPDDKIPVLFDWVSRLAPDPFYSPSNMAALRQSIQDADAGKLTAHELIDA